MFGDAFVANKKPKMFARYRTVITVHSRKITKSLNTLDVRVETLMYFELQSTESSLPFQFV